MADVQDSVVPRRHVRLPIRMSVRISTIDPETDPFTGRPFFRTSRETCANLSRGGAFVLTDEPLSPGRRLLVELEIPDGPSLQAVGRVAWSKKVLAPTGNRSESGVGIEFVGGSAQDFRELEEHLRTLRSARRDGDSARPRIGIASSE
ncbi:MAG: PilZ domain-containing protein [Proteobacteria bacterium]|nr:PilZ domain-containing protein [Pseudomonadota bacterium]